MPDHRPTWPDPAAGSGTQKADTLLRNHEAHQEQMREQLELEHSPAKAARGSPGRRAVGFAGCSTAERRRSTFKASFLCLPGRFDGEAGCHRRRGLAAVVRDERVDIGRELERGRDVDGIKGPKRCWPQAGGPSRDRSVQGDDGASSEDTLCGVVDAGPGQGTRDFDRGEDAGQDGRLPRSPAPASPPMTLQRSPASPARTRRGRGRSRSFLALLAERLAGGYPRRDRRRHLERGAHAGRRGPPPSEQAVENRQRNARPIEDDHLVRLGRLRVNSGTNCDPCPRDVGSFLDAMGLAPLRLPVQVDDDDGRCGLAGGARRSRSDGETRSPRASP